MPVYITALVVVLQIRTDHTTSGVPALTNKYPYKLMHESIPAASIHPPGKPRAFDSQWVLGAGHLAVNNVPSRAFANIKKTCFVTYCRCFRRRSLRVRGFKQRHFEIRNAFIDQQRTYKSNKTICFVFVHSEWLVLWPVLCSSIELKQYCLLKYGN